MQISVVNTQVEVAEVAQLAARIWHQHYTDILTDAQIVYMVEQFQSEAAIAHQIQAQNYTYYLLIEGNHAVGYMGIQQQDASLFLSKLYIDQAFRGRGIGKQAIQHAEQVAREAGYTKVWLTVNRYNTQSKLIYEKQGFKVAKEEQTAIGEGYIMDDYIMEKHL